MARNAIRFFAMKKGTFTPGLVEVGSFATKRGARACARKFRARVVAIKVDPAEYAGDRERGKDA